MNTGSMLKKRPCDFSMITSLVAHPGSPSGKTLSDVIILRQPHAPAALPIKRVAVCVPQLLGTEKTNDCSLQTGTWHTVMRSDVLTKVGIRKNSSGL
jgi:hypothetical protein